MAEQQNTKSKRDAFTERLKGKYPDKSFDDDEAIFGQISDDYDDYDQRIGQSQEREQKITNLFKTSPEASRMMTDWADGKDPVLSYVSIYGKDMLDAANDPEKQKQIEEANKEYVERLTKSKEYEEEYSKNLDESLATVDEVQKELGLDDAQTDKLLEDLGRIAGDAIMGKFSAETLRMIVKAQNHDQDVATAAEEAEIRGRNTKIDEKLRQAKKGDGTPQLAGANAPAQPKRPDLGALDNFGDGTSIWDRGDFKRKKNS